MWKAHLISEYISFHADHFKLHVNQHQRAKCRYQARLCSPVPHVLLLNWSTIQKYIFKQCSQYINAFLLVCD